MAFIKAPSVIWSGRHLYAAHQLIAQGAAYRRRHGSPLNDYERAVIDEISNATTVTTNLQLRQERQQKHPTSTQWVTTEIIAQQRKCSVRTVQRHAKEWGGVKPNGQWLFPPIMQDHEGE